MAKCEVEVLEASFCYLEAQDVFLVPAFPAPCQARLGDLRASPSSHELRRSEALPREGEGEEERGGGRPFWRRATPPLTTHGLLGVRGGGVSKSIEVRRVVDIASQAYGRCARRRAANWWEPPGTTWAVAKVPALTLYFLTQGANNQHPRDISLPRIFLLGARILTLPYKINTVVFQIRCDHLPCLIFVIRQPLVV